MAGGKRWLPVHGLRARARIVSIGTTVRVVFDRPVLRLEVLVRHEDGRDPYRAWLFTAPQYHLAQSLRPGVWGPVLIDPENPSQVVIDWDTAAVGIPRIAEPVGGYDQAWMVGAADAAGNPRGVVGPPGRWAARLSAVGRHWPAIVLGLATSLLCFDALVVVLAVVGRAPEWLLSLLSLGIWGPILLGLWLVLGRRENRRRRVEAVGVPSRASVESVAWAHATVNGRRLLKIGLSVRPPGGGSSYRASIRNAPPFHLTELLQPGAWLPVKVDPNDPANVTIDWKLAERESSPTGDQAEP